MRRPRRWTRRAWLALGGALALLGGGAAWLAPRPDPWPARASWPTGGESLVEWAAADRVLLDGPDGPVTVDPRTETHRPIPAAERLWDRTVSADGRHFVATAEREGGAWDVAWGDAASARVEGRFADERWVLCHPSFDPTGRAVRAFARDPKWPQRIKEVATWDLATGAKTSRPITGPRWSHYEVVSPDRRVIAYPDRRTHAIQFWDAEGDRPLGAPIGADPTPLVDAAGATFRPDGRQVILNRVDGRAELWGVDGTQIRRLVVHDGYEAEAQAVSRDGRMLVSVGVAQEPRSWLGRAVRQLQESTLDGWERIPREVVLIDLATGRRLARTPGAIGAEFSPDGRSVATIDRGGTLAIRATPAAGP